MRQNSMKRKREGGSSLPFFHFFIYVPYHFSFLKATHLIALLRFSKLRAFSHLFFQNSTPYRTFSFFRNCVPFLTFDFFKTIRRILLLQEIRPPFLHFALRSEPRVFPYGRSPTRGATAMGINIESIRFAVFTLVHPSIFVPIRMITREPVTDI